MQDRVSLYPGRVKLEPVAGQANTYDITRADQPTQEGTPLNKANLLSDATAAAIKALLASQTDNPVTPNDALNILAQAVEDVATVAAGKCSMDTSTYTGTGTYGSANPVTLTFPQKPALIFVMDDNGSFLILTPRSRWAFAYMGRNGVAQTVTWSGNSVSWWSDGGNANNQFNASNNVYQVFAFLKTNKEVSNANS